MAKPTNTKVTAPTAAKGRSGSAGAPGRPGWLLPAVLVAGVAVLLIAAVVVTRLGGAGVGGGDGLAQTRPVTVAGAALPTLESPESDPAVGTVAPTVTGSTFEGRPVQIGGTGRPVMVLFVAHWCPHCQREVPLLAPELGRVTPAGVDVITVSTSVRDSDPNYPPSAWLKREGWPGTVLADDTGASTADAYGLSGFPYFLLLDRDSKVVARTSGEKTVPDVEAMLKRIAPTPA